MFKPVPMKKVRLGVLDCYVENTIRELSKLSTLHIVDIKERIEELPEINIEHNSKNSEQCADFLRKINNIMELLGIDDKYYTFNELKVIKEKPLNEQLLDIKNKFENIEKKILQINNRIPELSEKENKLKEDKKELEILSSLDIDIDCIKESHLLYTVAGIVELDYIDLLKEELNNVIGKEYIALGVEKTIDNKIPTVISTVIENKEKLDEILSTLDFTRVRLEKYNGKTEDALEIVNRELEKIKKEKHSLIQEIDTCKEEYTEDLLIMKEIVLIEKEIADVESLLGKTKRVYILEGWIPQKKIHEMLRRIRNVTDEHLFIRIEDPKDNEIVPTYLDNPKIFKPFEILTETFGFPSYDEIDPTPLLAITFPILFGLMFGDFGHGLIVALIGLMLFIMGEKTLKDLGFITLTCGISAMIFGVMYGDVFGLHNIIPVIWINPLHNPQVFLLIAISIGAIHIGLGLLTDLIKMIRKREYLNALLEPIPKLWLYYGLILFFYINSLKYGMNIMEWVNNILSIPLIVTPLLIITISGIIKHLSNLKPTEIPALLGEGGFEAFDTILVFLSNTISYSRVFALALVHGGLFLALFSATGALTGIDSEHLVISNIISPIGLIWLIIIFMGTMLIIALEGLIVFLHTLRLHYYEWFTKFFEASGIKYRPFTVQRTYTLIK